MKQKTVKERYITIRRNHPIAGFLILIFLQFSMMIPILNIAILKDACEDKPVDFWGYLHFYTDTEVPVKEREVVKE